jgi:hypothetical protein
MEGVLADFDAYYEVVFGTRRCKNSDNVDRRRCELSRIPTSPSCPYPISISFGHASSAISRSFWPAFRGRCRRPPAQAGVGRQASWRPRRGPVLLCQGKVQARRTGRRADRRLGEAQRPVARRRRALDPMSPRPNPLARWLSWGCTPATSVIGRSVIATAVPAHDDQAEIALSRNPLERRERGCGRPRFQFKRGRCKVAALRIGFTRTRQGMTERRRSPGVRRPSARAR